MTNIIAVNETEMVCMTLDVQFLSPKGGVRISVETDEGSHLYVHYIFAEEYIWYDKGKNIYLGLGSFQDSWVHLARNLTTDVVKGLNLRLKVAF